jgi:hypothetical protein
MKERPILFSTPMVQAIMEGRKTQTRRIAKGHALQFLDAGLLSEYVSKQDLCPYGELGDILWVRETWALPVDADGNDAGYQYKADYSDGSERWKWKPSIHMQKSACRLFLQITYIAIERLNDISDDDAIKEMAKMTIPNCGSEKKAFLKVMSAYVVNRSERSARINRSLKRSSSKFGHYRKRDRKRILNTIRK